MASNSHSSAHWDQRYLSGDAPWNSGLVSRELARVLQEEHVAPCRAVELGCGVGTNAVQLAQQGFDVLASDCSAVAIERARSHAVEAKLLMRTAVADLCRVSELRRSLGEAAATFERQCSFLFDRGCYHCARRVDLAGFLETVEWLAAPNAQLLLLCGNANEPVQQGPPKVTEEEIRSDWGHLFEIEWIREFRFEDRGGVPGPLGWACWMTRRSAG
jgi:methyl halide transferase